MSDQNLHSLREDLAMRLAATLRGSQLYPPDHPLQQRHLDELLSTLALLHEAHPTVALGIIDAQIVVADTPVPRTARHHRELLSRLTTAGIERIRFKQGLTQAELSAFIRAVAMLTQQQHGDTDALRTFPHITVGRISASTNSDGVACDMTAIKRLYDDATRSAEDVFESTRIEGRPEVTVARGTVEELADTVVRNRPALIALTAMTRYENYTFTHMVNVSILVMAQAHALGIAGTRLTECGLAGLMHDIGKVRTPAEILRKTSRLTEDECACLRRHVVDGAELLRQTPGIPIMASTVALEHHLRLDGTGYPPVKRATLNLATMLTGIADVYDAMRSQRAYQQAFPTDRIVALIQCNDGQQFDRHLARRFVQLVGVYPPGTLVRLSTDEVALVIQAHAPDPHRPRVRLLRDRAGQAIPSQPIRHLWETVDGEGDDIHVIAPLDPEDLEIDPLEHF